MLSLFRPKQEKKPEEKTVPTSRYLANSAFLHIKEQIESIRDKSAKLNHEVKALPSSSVHKPIVAKSTILNEILYKIDRACQHYNQHKEISDLNLLIMLAGIVNHMLKQNYDELNAFQSSVKPIISATTTALGVAGAATAAATVLSNPVGIGLVGLFGGDMISTKAKKACDFSGSKTDTVLKLIELRYRILTAVKVEADKISLDLKDTNALNRYETIVLTQFPKLYREVASKAQFDNISSLPSP